MSTASLQTMPRVSRARAAGLAAVFAVAGLAVLALPGLGDVRDRFAGADGGWLLAVGALELASCLSFVVAFRAVMCRRLPWRLSHRVAMAVQGTNVLVPTGGAGGLALGAWALCRGGMPAEWIARRTVTLFVATSSVNFLTALGAGALLSAGLLGGGVPAYLAAAPAIAAIVVMAGTACLPALLDSPSARVPGRLTGAARRTVADGLRDVGRLVGDRRADAAAAAAGYMFFDLAALAAAFAALGDVPALGVLLIAYPLGQLGGLIPLPGGLGGTDGGLIGALALYGTPLSEAAAAVLAYRVFQLGLPAILGVAALGGIPRALRRFPAAASNCAPTTA